MKSLIFLFCFLSSICAAETLYFNKNGHRITEKEYKELRKEMIQKKEALERRHRITLVIKEEVKEEMPKDTFGRPLKTSEGNWIIYPDQQTPGDVVVGGFSRGRRTGSGHSDYRRSKYGYAREADRHRENYLRSGRTTDLVKFRESLRRAIR